jgi:hypothetical protein
VKNLKYLVVGTGRCGTVYVAKLLSSIGIPCTHEAIFRHDGIDAALDRLQCGKELEVSFISKLASVIEERSGVRWFNGNDREEVIAESSYLASPYIDHPSLKNVIIIHLVRHPMKVINSFVSGFEYFNDWCLTAKDYKDCHKLIYEFIPELNQEISPVLLCALYCVRWNQMIEKKAKGHQYFLYKVENEIDLFNYLNLYPTNYYNNRKSNTKLGLLDNYNSFNQIPDGNIKDELINLYKKYYPDVSNYNYNKVKLF